jgi:SAM-dependent methyltransferase
MSERPWREEWDGQADDWLELTTDDPFFDRFNKPEFLTLVPAPGRLTLDVGCGEGRMARELTALGHHVVGVDGSPSLAREAARHPQSTAVAAGDITALPVASGVADLVVCFMVLMDVEDLDRGVAELARALAPGGVVCAAILHPILTSGLFAPDDPNQTFLMGEYRRPMRHVITVGRPNGQSFPLRLSHRPIEDYSRAFEGAGLAITALREPRPSDALVAAHPAFAPYQRVPDFLHVRARRVDDRAVC